MTTHNAAARLDIEIALFEARRRLEESQREDSLPRQHAVLKTIRNLEEKLDRLLEDIT